MQLRSRRRPVLVTIAAVFGAVDAGIEAELVRLLAGLRRWSGRTGTIQLNNTFIAGSYRKTI